MDITREISEGYKVWIALGGVGLVGLWWLLPRRAAKVALIVLTLVACCNQARWGPKVALEQLDSYDLIHYYLGAKYFDELGYYDLYPAALLVDHENGPYTRKLRRFRAQDEEGYRPRTRVAEGVERGRKVRDQRFTRERWKAFEHDFLVLQRESDLSRSLWVTLANDRGFNATPVWVIVARPFAEVFPVEAIKVLAYFDVVFLLVGLVAIGWAYGWVPAVFSLFFLAVTYSLRWPIPGTAFFRYDWVAALLLALALLKKGRHFLAGVCTGYAALVRIFPAVWMFGPFTKGVLQLWHQRAQPWRARLQRPLLAMALGFGACVLVLEGAAIGSLGADTVQSHARNLGAHVKPEELSSRRMGFAIGLAYDGGKLPKILSRESKLRIKEQKTLRLILAGILLALLALGLSRRRDDETFAYGFIPFFMLATFSYYYAVARITLIAFHAAHIHRRRDQFGLAALLAIEALTNWLETTYPGHRVLHMGWLCWTLTLYAVTLTVWLILRPDPAENPT
jgi:hypothetical protein